MERILLFGGRRRLGAGRSPAGLAGPERVVERAATLTEAGTGWRPTGSTC